MDIIKYFFRTNKDPVRFEAYSLEHLILLLLMLGVSLLLFLKKDLIRKNKSLDKFIRYLLMSLIIFQQGTFLYFNFVLRENGLALGLPLYTCRIALYTGFFALATSWKMPKAVTVYWGFVGGIIPMIVPDLEYYLWPHISVLNYFLTHFLVFWSASYLLFVKNFKFSKNTLNLNLFFTNIFLTISLIVNLLFGGNYAYLSTSPIFKDMLMEIPKPIYVLAVYLVYNLFALIVHIIGVNGLKLKANNKVSLESFLRKVNYNNLKF